MPREIPYPHPGGILLEEFLKPPGISQYRLAKEARAHDTLAEALARIRRYTPEHVAM